MKLLKLLSILMVCQLFDVFGGGEGRGICAILFFFDYGIELNFLKVKRVSISVSERLGGVGLTFWLIWLILSCFS